jgi:DNA-binding transcriptional ArsR family regulator
MTPQRFLSVEPDGIPSELKALRQFVAWKPKWNAKKKRWQKVPIDPHTGRHASVKQPSTWGTLDEALARMTADGLPGIGFVFTKADPYAGIDLDDVIGGEGIAFDAQAILDHFPTYREFSPSGTGVHILLKCVRPLDDWNRQPGIEVYQHGRFFTMTGRPIPGTVPDPGIAECSATAFAWHEAMTPTRPMRTRANTSAGVAGPVPHGAPSDADAAIIASCRKRWPTKFPRLFAGDCSDYDGDQSRADQALVAYFVKAGATNPDTIDSLFRTSGLMRQKWDRLDYRAGTIRKALEAVVPGESTLDDVEVLRREVARLKRELANSEARSRQNGDVLNRILPILRNSGLKNARLVATALFIKFAHFESRGIDPPYQISLTEIAEAVGMSRNTVSRHVSGLQSAGLLRRSSLQVPGQVDPETGEIVAPRQTTFMEPIGSAGKFAERAVTLKLGPVWGGLRNNGFGRSQSTGSQDAERHEPLPFPPVVADHPADPLGEAA